MRAHKLVLQEPKLASGSRRRVGDGDVDERVSWTRNGGGVGLKNVTSAGWKARVSQYVCAHETATQAQGGGLRRPDYRGWLSRVATRRRIKDGCLSFAARHWHAACGEECPRSEAVGGDGAGARQPVEGES